MSGVPLKKAFSPLNLNSNCPQVIGHYTESFRLNRSLHDAKAENLIVEYWKFKISSGSRNLAGPRTDLFENWAYLNSIQRNEIGALIKTVAAPP